MAFTCHVLVIGSQNLSGYYPTAALPEERGRSALPVPPGPALSLLIWQSEEDSRSTTSIPTCNVELVELVIRQSCIPGAGLGLVLGAGGGLPCPPLMRGPLQQPPHQRQLLQAVADHVPGQAAGQVQAGSRQRSAENRQASLQV